MDVNAQNIYHIPMFCGYIDPGSGFNFFNSTAWLLSLLLSLAGTCLLYLKKIYFLLKKQKKVVIILLLLSFISGALLLGALLRNPSSSFNTKVIILGIDGLSPDIIEPMMAAGELPNFSRLKESGYYQRLATTNPSQSPVAWAAFATGRNPGENGIYDFIIRNPKDYSLRLSLDNVKNNRPRRVFKTKTFWQRSSDAGIPTVIIAHPLTFPPDKIYGRMLSGMGTPDILGTEGTFTFYTSEPDTHKKDIGGKVFFIKKQDQMTLDLIGPRVSMPLGITKNLRVPFKVFLKNDGIVVEYSGHRIKLGPEEWSSWQEIVFNITPFKKIKGIFKFYLVSLGPEFRLYISPIQFDPRSPLYPISYPVSYSKQLARDIGLFHTQGMPVDTWAVNEDRLGEKELIKQCEETLKERKAVFGLELDRLKKGILFCYFGTTDTIQHMFWRYIDPKHPLYEAGAPQEYKDMIKTWYKKMDGILGETMQKISPKDNLIVLSDHGFNTFRRAVHINSWLKQNGYLTLKNNSAEGAPLLKDIDWRNTKAYAIGFGAIYINQKGREKNGIVSPGKETEELKKDIAQKLKGWKDEKYQENIVRNVYKNEDIFKGPYAKGAPDLYVGFNIGYRASWQTALGAAPTALVEDNLKKWSGDHLFDSDLIPGILFSNKHIAEDNPSIYNLVPTILEIAGLDKK